MATLVKYDGGLFRIEFSAAADQSRTYIRLGRIRSKVAEGIHNKVSAIISDKLIGRPHDAEVSAWIGGLDERLLAKLRQAGLVEGVGTGHITLGKFLKTALGTQVVKTNTSIFYKHTVRCLLEFFPENAALRSISSQQADQFRHWLVKDQGLSQATVSRRILAARTFFKMAIRWGYLTKDPFAGVKAGKQTNPARSFHVPRETIRKIMDACPDDEWRVLVALSRFAELRCPSEHLGLKWEHIDWERQRMRVHSPKTEHHAGLESRWIPLFPEVREALLALRKHADPDSVYVITRYRFANQNLRTYFQRIIQRAGVVPWPRLFHNLRASCQTDLVRHHPIQAVCAWLGNTKGIALDHYLQVTEEDFKAAAADPTPREGGPQGAVKSAVDTPCQGLKGVDTEPGKNTTSPVFTRTCHQLSVPDNSLTFVGLGRAGIEPATQGFSDIFSPFRNGLVFPLQIERLPLSTRNPTMST